MVPFNLRIKKREFGELKYKNLNLFKPMLFTELKLLALVLWTNNNISRFVLKLPDLFIILKSMILLYISN